MAGQVELRSTLMSVMFLSHIYNPVRKFYLARYRLFIEWQAQVESDKSLQSSSINNQVREELNHDKQFTVILTQDDREPDISLPKIRDLYYTYYVVSNFTHFIGIFHSITLICIRNNSFGLNINLNCYIPGRLSIHAGAIKLLPYFQLISNFLHVLWRYANSYVEKEYKLDGLLFLLMDSGNLESRAVCISGQSQQHHNDYEYKENARLGDRRYIKPGETSNSELISKQILYLTTEAKGGGSKMILRPNRTILALKQLSTTFQRIMFWVFMISTFLLIVLLPNICYVGFLDFFYIQNYPTCLREIERELHSGQRSLWSISLFRSYHRIFCAPFDIIINFITWFDDLIALLLPTSITLILTEDLLIYWRYIEQKLEELLVKLKLKSDQLKYWNRGDFGKHSFTADSTSRMYRIIRDTTYTRKFQPQIFEETTDETHILQRYMIDFFHQLKHYNRFVSLLTATLFIIWITMFITTNYMAIKMNSFQGILIIRLLQIYSGAALTGPVYYLLRLRKSTKRAYGIIGAIMAYETSPHTKMAWSNILEYYTYRPRYGFTLLHHYPLTWMSYLNVIATSVSFLVIVETYYRHPR